MQEGRLQRMNQAERKAAVVERVGENLHKEKIAEYGRFEIESGWFRWIVDVLILDMTWNSLFNSNSKLLVQMKLPFLWWLYPPYHFLSNAFYVGTAITFCCSSAGIREDIGGHMILLTVTRLSTRSRARRSIPSDWETSDNGSICRETALPTNEKPGDISLLSWSRSFHPTFTSDKNAEPKTRSETKDNGKNWACAEASIPVGNRNFGRSYRLGALSSFQLKLSSTQTFPSEVAKHGYVFNMTVKVGAGVRVVSESLSPKEAAPMGMRGWSRKKLISE